MPNNIKISEMAPAEELNTTDLLMVSQQDTEVETEYDSKSTSVAQLAGKIATGVQFTSELDTDSKTIAGAINEAAAVGKKSGGYTSTGFHADFDYLTGNQWEDSGETIDGHKVYRSSGGTYQSPDGDSLCIFTVEGYKSVTFYIKQDGASSSVTNKAYLVMGDGVNPVSLQYYNRKFNGDVFQDFVPYTEYCYGLRRDYEFLYHVDQIPGPGTCAFDGNNGQWVDSGETVDGHTVYKSDAGSYGVYRGTSKCTLTLNGVKSISLYCKSESYYGPLYAGELDTAIDTSDSDTYKRVVSDNPNYVKIDYVCEDAGEHTLEILFMDRYGDGLRGYFYYTINEVNTNRGYVYMVPGEPTEPKGEIFNDYTNNVALGYNSHAEGAYSKAFGSATHAEGYNTQAIGDYSHAEGYENKAYGESNHVEGGRNETYGEKCHAEGADNIVRGSYAHVEGRDNQAIGTGTHAEGGYNLARDYYAHAEGQYTKALGGYSHAEGYKTTALYTAAHAEGFETQANGSYAHAEGQYTQANSAHCHSEGYNTITNSGGGHSEGCYTLSDAWAAHAEGSYTIASGEGSHAEGSGSDNAKVIASGEGSHAEGRSTTASGSYSHAEGKGNTASGQGSHTEGFDGYSGANVASGISSHAEGGGNTTSGNCSHAEGTRNIAFAEASHAEGSGNLNMSYQGHAEGAGNTVGGENSHIEGAGNYATAKHVHVEGSGNNSKPSASHSHIEGAGNSIYGESGHVEGAGNTGSGIMVHVEGAGNQIHGHKSHGEGGGNYLNGYGSHTEGKHNVVIGTANHAEGRNNTVGIGDTSFGTFSYGTTYEENDIVCANALYSPEDDYDRPSMFRCVTTPGQIQAGNGIEIINPTTWNSETSYSANSVVKATFSTQYGRQIAGYYYCSSAIAAGKNPLVKDSGWIAIDHYLSPLVGEPAHSSTEFYLLSVDAGDYYSSYPVAKISPNTEVSAMWEAVPTASYSHVEGFSNIASGDCQHVQGKFNNPDAQKAFIIGNGSETEGTITRSNAMTVDWSGNMALAGDVTVGTSLNTTATTIGGAINEIVARIPAPPTVDGTYTLSVTVSNGVSTYSWV